MAGVFPDGGVTAATTLNGVDVPTVGCESELFYAVNRCAPRFEPAAANALISEVLNAVAASGLPYDCSRLDNLALAIDKSIADAEPTNIICALPALTGPELEAMDGTERIAMCVDGVSRTATWHQLTRGFIHTIAATTLTAADLDKFVEIAGASSYTITLPDPDANSTTGGMYYFYNASSSDKTISTPGGNFIGPGGTGQSTMRVPRGGFVWVVSGFDNWIVLEKSWSTNSVTTTTTLTPNNFDGYTQLSGAVTYTVTLPDPEAYSGASIEIYNAGAVNYTLATPNGNFEGPLGSTNPTMLITPNQYISFRAALLNWVAH